MYYSYLSSPNVTGQARPTGRTLYDCSVRRPSQCDNLWVVAWNRLLDRIFFISWLFFARQALEIEKIA